MDQGNTAQNPIGQPQNQPAQVNPRTDDEEYEEVKETRHIPLGLIIGVLIIIFLLLGLGVALLLIQQRTNLTGSAYGPTTGEIELANSYMFASPLKATAGAEKIRVTVFILDSQGRGISGKEVVLGKSDSSMQIDTVQDITDDLGRAIFDVSSNTPGLYILEGRVENEVLPQKVNVTFK